MLNATEIVKDVFTVTDFLSDDECNRFIEQSEKNGYDEATIETDKGARLIKEVRDNQRVLYTDKKLALSFWSRVQDFVPGKIGYSRASGLNELFRFYKYSTGQRFRKHIDQSFIRNETEASYYTLMIYLNDDYLGGETNFDTVSIKAVKGMALIFLHSLPHEGSEVAEGVKYVLRTDIMYQLQRE